MPTNTMPDVHFFFVSPPVFWACHAYSMGVIPAKVETYVELVSCSCIKITLELQGHTR